VTSSPRFSLLTQSKRLVILAPTSAGMPSKIQNIEVSQHHHKEVLSKVQRLRGASYLRDGAIQSEHLTADGRHLQREDNASFHIVTVEPDGRVTGCARLHQYAPNAAPEDLRAWDSALAQNKFWQDRVRRALKDEMAFARRSNLSFVEVGGWAVAPDQRFTPEALRIILSTFALARAIGGCIGITTATVRNCSAKILQRTGGSPLRALGQPLPPYYDPQYKCEMEILRFHSNAPLEKYQDQLQDIANRLADVRFICATDAAQHQPIAMPAEVLPNVA